MISAGVLDIFPILCADMLVLRKFIPPNWRYNGKGHRRIELDRIDSRILTALQADANQAIAGLSGSVGLSANATWRRIKRLEEQASSAATSPPRSREAQSRRHRLRLGAHQ